MRPGCRVVLPSSAPSVERWLSGAAEKLGEASRRVERTQFLDHSDYHDSAERGPLSLSAQDPRCDELLDLGEEHGVIALDLAKEAGRLAKVLDGLRHGRVAQDGLKVGKKREWEEE